MRRPWLIVMLLFCSTALGFDYFGGRIDYWNEKTSAKPSPTKIEPKIPQEKQFDWEKYTNPKHDEFFEEGDHKPPKPFMELARNPTDQNIKRWFALIEKKNTLMVKLHDHMKTYLAKNSKTLKPKEREILTEKLSKIKPIDLDLKRFRFRLYFDSTCPHCERMMVTARDLQKMGYFVEVRQIDSKKPNFPVPFAVVKASAQEISRKKINSWPVLFVADTSKKLVYRINGYQKAKSILNTLSTK
ncbi:MAG: TlpA family protein disulfide reductase [Oligoflexales bacterium]